MPLQHIVFSLVDYNIEREVIFCFKHLDIVTRITTFISIAFNQLQVAINHTY